MALTPAQQRAEERKKKRVTPPVQDSRNPSGFTPEGAVVGGAQKVTNEASASRRINERRVEDTQPEVRNVGIRPGQFGEIDESGTSLGMKVVEKELVNPDDPNPHTYADIGIYAIPEQASKTGAGEHVEFENGRAVVKDQEGNTLRDVGSVYSVEQRTADTRRQVGEPFTDPRSGARGVAGSTGMRRTTIEDLEELERKEIENVRASGGKGYGGDVQLGEKRIRSNYEAERKRILDKQESDRIKKETEMLEMPDTEAIENLYKSIPQVDGIITSIQGLSAESLGVRQEIFNAYLPSLNQLLLSAQSVRSRIEEIDTQSERSAIAEEAIEPQKELASRREMDLKNRLEADKQFLKENRDILVEQNKLIGEAIDLDKQLFEEEARISEIRQMAANAEGEKALRRSLNSLGIENSPASVEYLQSKIQEAADTLESMIKTNNLSSLKFTNAREQIQNGLRSTLTEFESKLAGLNANFDDNIFGLDQFVSGARSEVLSDLKSEYSTLLEKEDKLMMDFGGKIETLVTKGLEMQQEHEKTEAEAARWDYEQGWKEYSFGVNKELQLLQIEISRSNAEAAREDRDINRAIRLDQTAQSRLLNVQNQISSRIQGDTNVKDFKQSSFHFNTLSGAYRNATSQSGKNFTDQVLIMEFNKLTDPSSVVRESEYNRSAEGLGVMRSLYSKFLKNLGVGIETRDDGSLEFSLGAGGALTPGAREELFRVAEQIHNSRKEMYLNETIQQYYLQIDQYNSIAPSEYQLIPEQFGLPSYSTLMQRDTFMQHVPEGYHSPYWSPPDGGGGVEIPTVGSKIDSLSITGIVTGYGSKKSKAGVDIAAPKGTPVRLGLSGTIKKVVDIYRVSFPNNDEKGREQNGGYGNQVIVKFDNGYEGLFNHFDRTAVQGREGERIDAGTIIGFVGNTGNTYGKTGVHLDFELRDENGVKLSPQEAARFLIHNRTS